MMPLEQQMAYNQTYLLPRIISNQKVFLQEQKQMRKSSNSERQAQKRCFTVTKTKANQHLESLTFKETFRFYVGPGNNASLIRRILSTRKNWEEVNDPKHIFLNFKWHQSNKSFKYETCVENKIIRNCYNHFQFHQELSDKERLFRNLSEYCELHRIELFDFVPLTFILNFTNPKCDESLNLFMKIYQNNLPEKMKESNEEGTLFIKKRGKMLSRTSQLKWRQNKQKLPIKSCFMEDESKYLWILKPTFKNRGNGIHVFNNLLNLEKIINSYTTGQHNNKSAMNLDSQTPEIKIRRSFRIREYSNRNNDVVRSFVIQKYLQKPLLIDERKFDIRVWVLISHDMKVYFFKQGYIRTSSYKYSTEESTIGDNNVHLTNNAVQKENEQYGKFEDGNQLSFRQLKNLVEKQGKSFTELITKIKQIIKITVLSVKKKINKHQRHYCLQIFGYDFMLDAQCNPWLIEVNTNPCIEESSGLLSCLLPRMLDDAFCLTLDRVFDTEKKGYNYTIENEYSTDNLWQLVVDLKKSSRQSTSQQVI